MVDVAWPLPAQPGPGQRGFLSVLGRPHPHLLPPGWASAKETLGWQEGPAEHRPCEGKPCGEGIKGCDGPSGP